MRPTSRSSGSTHRPSLTLPLLLLLALAGLGVALSLALGPSPPLVRAAAIAGDGDSTIDSFRRTPATRGDTSSAWPGGALRVSDPRGGTEVALAAQATPPPCPRPTPSGPGLPVEVTGVTPSSGPYFGGTTVIITGSGFDTRPGCAIVSFIPRANAPGGGSTNGSCPSTTQCTATTPAGPTGGGTVDVRVANPDGGVNPDTPADDFTYISPDATAMTLTGTAPAGSSGTLRALVPPSSATTARAARTLAPAGSGPSFWQDASQSSAARSLAQAPPAGTVCGQVEVAAGGSFTMPVFAGTQIPGCGTAGALLTFTLSDQPVAPAQPVTFQPGGSADLGTVTPGPGPMPPPEPLLPMVISGSATLQGHPAPLGIPVRAYVGATLCGRSSVLVLGAFVLLVDSATQTPGCGTPGAALRFALGDAPAIATPPVSFQSLGVALIQLAAP